MNQSRNTFLQPGIRFMRGARCTLPYIPALNRRGFTADWIKNSPTQRGTTQHKTTDLSPTSHRHLPSFARIRPHSHHHSKGRLERISGILGALRLISAQIHLISGSRVEFSRQIHPNNRFFGVQNPVFARYFGKALSCPGRSERISEISLYFPLLLT